MDRIEKKIEVFGNALVALFHNLGLFVIGATVVWAAVQTYMPMMEAGHASLHDILLLFIYLELGAMVGIYFKTKHLPVRFLIYIAITALTRMLTIDIKTMSNEQILTICAATLILAIAVFVLESRPGCKTHDESHD